MNETEFIESCLRYVDGAANRKEVERLGEVMLASPERRTIYRELVQQSQLSHEWLSTNAQPSQPVVRPTVRIISFAAAAAALIVATLFLLRTFDFPADSVSPKTAMATPELPKFFQGSAPSWSEIYGSLFDFPDLVWRSEFQPDTGGTERLDAFSDFDYPSLLAAPPAPEFSRRLEPIVLLPNHQEFGSKLY